MMLDRANRKSGVVAALFVLAFCVSAAWAAPEQAMREAQAAMKAGEHSRAVALLEPVVDEDPTLAEAHRMLGHAHLGAGDALAARRAFIDALEHGRPTVDVLGGLVMVDQQSDRAPLLGPVLAWLALAQPDNAQWPLLLAQHAQRTGRPRAGIAHAQRALESSADPASALQLMGNLHVELDEHERALTYYETAYHLGAGSAALARTIAQLHDAADAPDAAVDWYRRARGLGEDRPSLALREAQLMLQADDAQGAAALLDELLKQGLPDAVRAHRLRGQAAEALGDEAGALAHWQKAIEQGAGDAQLLGFVGGRAYRDEQWEKAAALLERYVEAGGPQRDLHAAWVVSLIELEQAEPARAALREYVARFGLDESAVELVSRLSS